MILFRVIGIIDYQTIEVVRWNWRDLGLKTRVRILGLRTEESAENQEVARLILESKLTSRLIEIEPRGVVEEGLVAGCVYLSGFNLANVLPRPEPPRRMRPAWQKLFGFLASTVK